MDSAEQVQVVNYYNIPQSAPSSLREERERTDRGVLRHTPT